LIQIKAARHGPSDHPATNRGGNTMIGYAEAPHAWTRAQRMAQAGGLNLAGAVVDGWLARHELARIVACCSACPQDAACGDWLDHAVPVTRAPVFCANGPVIAGLSPVEVQPDPR
jgi:Family of unknown function (DUF6455)